MGLLDRVLARVGARRVIVGLGGLYLTFAVARALLAIAAGKPLTGVLSRLILVGGPGILILYGGHRLPQMDLHPDVHPRIITWCLGGVGLLLGIVVLRVLDPGVTIDSPFESAVLATALGSLAGFAIGMYDTQSISRARKAEQYSDALEQANDRLETQHQRLESFAGMLAHELRNPLQIAQIYHQQEQPQDEDAAAEVATAHGRIEEMIDILLVTVQGTSRSTSLEPVTLADVATDAWTAVTTDATGGDLDVETEQTIQADPAHLRYLFRQLFRNSLEHGGAEVTVRVSDLADRDGFYIEDDGPGIPTAVHDDVVEAGVTTKPDGRGLGLTFVAQLAETYEWDWAITDSEASGARFEFTDVDRVLTEEEGLHRN